MAAKGYVTLTLEAYPEGKASVSRCRELDVTSCGDTLYDALDQVKEAVSVYLDAIEQLGDRERIFEERGIVVHSTKPRTVRVVTEALPPNSVAGTVVLPLSRVA